MMAQNVTKNQKTWDKYLPELAFAYNPAQHESTGHTPAYLNFGRELNSRGSVAQQAALPQRDEHHRRIRKLEEALELAKIKIAQSFQKQQKYYNLRRRNWAPEIEDKVLKKMQYLSDKVAGFNAKLAEKCDVPYTVKKKPSPVIVDLQDERGKYCRHVHIGNLKPYQEPIKRANEEICTTLRPGTGNPASNPWKEGEQWRRGNTVTELTSTSQAQRPAHLQSRCRRVQFAPY